MGVFENCRICLSAINHEPIKMTRLILSFLDNMLKLANIAKPCPQDNSNQNLCAPCFNKISEFQDFFEQCKESDEFWKRQFEEFKETNAETVYFPLAEDSSSLEADTTVTTTELKKLTYIYEENNENSINAQQIKIEKNVQDNQENESILLSAALQTVDNDKELPRTVTLNSIDLNWPDDENEMTTCDANKTRINIEIIEFEYDQDDEDKEVEIEEVPSNTESISSEASGLDYGSLDYEEIEAETSANTTIIHESVKEAIEETQTKNFVFTKTLDEKGKVKTSYKCLHCDKLFNRIYDIESHCNIHIGVKPFTCNVCGKSFRQKNILTTHQALHFGKKVECVECGKRFARRSQLILHFRMHRDEKPFVCSFDGCQAAFRQKKQLMDHSFIHSGEKNFECATCTKAFYTRKRLQDHIYKVHSQYRYRCDLCVKSFLKPHMLKYHMMAAHSVEVGDVSHLKTLVDILKSTKKSISSV